MIYIAGPCVIDTEKETLEIAEYLRDESARAGVDFVFKASYDKANRTCLNSYRGPGIRSGLKTLKKVKHDLGVRILTDVHSVAEVKAVAKVADVIQIPAFLSRQTDLIVAAAKTGKIVNIKKGQFMSLRQIEEAADKCGKNFSYTKLWLTERGSCFGYDDLIVDFTNLEAMKYMDRIVIFDATHSIQGGNRTRWEAFTLARAAATCRIDGLFTEVHPHPETAKCDARNSLCLESVPKLLEEVCAIIDACH